jgi:hypothetical protein
MLGISRRAEKLASSAGLEKISTGHPWPSPKVLRGGIPAIRTCEIQEIELNQIRKLRSGGLYLDLTIFFLSTGLSFLVSLLTVTFSSDRLWFVFVATAMVGFGFGLVFVTLWYRDCRSITDIVDVIASRLPNGP